MSIDDFKQSLLSAPSPLVERVEVETTNGKAELHIRRPPDKVMTAILAAAEEAGIREGNEANVSVPTVLRFQSEVIAATVFAPNAVRPLFTVDEAQAWPQSSAVLAACMRAIIPPSVAVERAKGN